MEKVKEKGVKEDAPGLVVVTETAFMFSLALACQK
jgi:hypothetical protein